ncbi:MAG TPA: FtsX-like permease family protein, partial [Actinotalea sp.]|nr:FtsX-like permease family protein [Actinotalea sp.]
MRALVVDTLLAVVVGLLGVAVVIAVVGVANTLSLSVIERRRESATLRAIGMTRTQLRGSLAIEGLLVALVGTVVGALLGVGYGFVGAHVLLAEVSDVRLAVPWRDLAVV